MEGCGGLAIEARLSCTANFGYKGALPEKSLWKHVLEWQRILHAWKWPPLGQRWVTQNREGQSLVKEKRFSTNYIWSLEDDRPVRVKVSKEISFTRWATYYSKPYHLFKDGRIKKVHSELYLNVMRIAICQVYCCFLYESFLRLLPGHSLSWAGLPRRPLACSQDRRFNVELLPECPGSRRLLLLFLRFPLPLSCSAPLSAPYQKADLGALPVWFHRRLWKAASQLTFCSLFCASRTLGHHWDGSRRKEGKEEDPVPFSVHWGCFKPKQN